jgi:hypothetical protein
MTAVEDHPAVSAAAFDKALAQMLIVWPESGEPHFAGCSSPAHEAVAAFVEDLLNANPPLVTYLHKCFVEVADGIAVVPVAALREALDMTATHGRAPWKETRSS